MLGYFGDSAIVHTHEATDCRRLKLSMEFYELIPEATASLVLDFIKWVDQICKDEMFAQWRLGSRCLGRQKLIDVLHCMLMENPAIDLQMDAYVSNPLVFNSASLRKYSSQLKRTIFPIHQRPNVSVDFKEFWTQLFPNGRCDNKTLKLRFSALFHEERKKHLSINIWPDASASVFCLPYQHNKALFHGSLSFDIGVFCLGNSVSKVANMFESYMQSVGSTYHHVNARVMLQPFTLSKSGSPYMDYFGQYCRNDGSHEEPGFTPNEWYYTYYLCGVEWSNMISPRVRTHIPQLMQDALSEKAIHASELNGGGVLLRSSKNIEDYDVYDAYALRRIVSDALYPGGCELPFRRMFEPYISQFSLSGIPRHNWAIVPVLDSEIEIIGSSLIIRSDNY